MGDTFTDLIYDDTAEPLIRARFPHVVVEDGRDLIHEDRIQITLPEADRIAFIKDAIRQGYYKVSLLIGLLQCDDRSGYLRVALDELKAETAARSRNGGSVEEVKDE